MLKILNVDHLGGTTKDINTNNTNINNNNNKNNNNSERQSKEKDNKDNLNNSITSKPDHIDHLSVRMNANKTSSEFYKRNLNKTPSLARVKNFRNRSQGINDTDDPSISSVFVDVDFEASKYQNQAQDQGPQVVRIIRKNKNLI